jgi:glycine/D-amino acid oxidase-like deaminating enzyme
VVIGAGAVGLTVARALAKRGVTVLVAEALGGPGMVTTGRNRCVCMGMSLGVCLYFRCVRACVCVRL